jgi:hypothetical protein
MHMHSMRVFATRLGLVLLFVIAAAFSFGLSASPASAESPRAADSRLGAKAPAAKLTALDPESWAKSAVRSIKPKVLALALGASRCAIANGVVESPTTLTIIDYSKASIEPRLWVLDLSRRQVIYEELVSHGQGSGGNFATKFSNVPDSHQTSIGLFVTDTTYVGRNGYSLRLEGLDKGFNDLARDRAIVMHGAPYVSAEVAKSLGRLGRSHGCPAVSAAVARELIDRVKGGNLLFSYYPDENWLENSKYLGACGS